MKARRQAWSGSFSPSGDCRRCVVAVEGRQAAAGAEDARRLRQRKLRLGDVAEARVEDHGVEGLVVERKPPAVALGEGHVVDPARELSGSFDEQRRRINADRLVDAVPAGERPRDSAGSATDLEHTGVWRKRNLAEVCLPQRTLLGVGRAHFEHVGELADNRRIGVLDRRVESGMFPRRTVTAARWTWFPAARPR